MNGDLQAGGSSGRKTVVRAGKRNVDTSLAPNSVGRGRVGVCSPVAGKIPSRRGCTNGITL